MRPRPPARTGSWGVMGGAMPSWRCLRARPRSLGNVVPSSVRRTYPSSSASDVGIDPPEDSPVGTSGESSEIEEDYCSL
ncbi:hypothetical protein NDU88_006065 [Pleurodeles waltl]|uniref:Secreted protein n=1 Tax=Pleurodeles waltl TaxID=8319 RepID=A0AAV7RQ65_PLEWA|nr:hypothetical protein NDU88_006065 [Pleurodeles waltl]